jgi:hypothetical protein
LFDLARLGKARFEILVGQPGQRISDAMAGAFVFDLAAVVCTPTWGPGSNGTANRLKRSASPVALRALHAGIAL